MNILVTGGTGFIGSALCSRLLDERHDIVVLSRNPESVKAPAKGIDSLAQLDEALHFEVVINLAGEPIADKRWSAEQKQRITGSRLDTTRELVAFIERAAIKPKLLISGSAIGYYGVGVDDEAVTEAAHGDDSFSSQLCQQWETLALEAKGFGVRTCLLRTGIVLGKGGGALNKMLLPFKLGLGGRVGEGSQWMPWIHMDDLVGIILHCIGNAEVQGAVNGTASNPVTNREFTKSLGKVLGRPTIFPMPSQVIKLLMGQMGEELLLSGKRVLPDKVSTAGYTFSYENLDDALSSVV